MNVQETAKETTLCLAGAHALVKLDDGTIVGDPMEKTTLDALEWTLGQSKYLGIVVLSINFDVSLRRHSYACEQRRSPQY